MCGKPDWCTYTDRVVCCMRVTSPREAKNGGWIHAITDKPKLPPRPKNEHHAVEKIDAPGLMAQFREGTTAAMLVELGRSLEVQCSALVDLAAAWAQPFNAWAFPMRKASGEVIGIRLRDNTGHKWAVRGSRAGLFFADGQSELVHICEGPTDTAAGLSIGLDCIGRASCLGLEIEVDALCQRKKAKRAIIVSDNDGPGHRGAVKLSHAMTIPTCLWIPPAKDLREFVRFGGTSEVIESLTRGTVWTSIATNR